jgi:hypothetical protein
VVVDLLKAVAVVLAVTGLVQASLFPQEQLTLLLLGQVVMAQQIEVHLKAQTALILYSPQLHPQAVVVVVLMMRHRHLH